MNSALISAMCMANDYYWIMEEIKLQRERVETVIGSTRPKKFDETEK